MRALQRKRKVFSIFQQKLLNMLKILTNLFYKERVLTGEELKQAADKLNEKRHNPSGNSVVHIILPVRIHIDDVVTEEEARHEDNQCLLKYEEQPTFEKIPHTKKLRKYPDYHHRNHPNSKRIRRIWEHSYYDRFEEAIK